MEDKDARNNDLTYLDIFSAANHYLLLLIGFSCLVASVFIQMLFLYLGLYRLGIALSALGGMALPVYLLTRIFPRGFARQIGLHRPQGAQLARAVVAGLLMVVVIDNVYLFSQGIFPVPEGYLESLIELKPTGVLSLVVTFFGLCIAVPIGEEILFRGYFQQIFARNMNGVLAFVLSGILFAVVHFNMHLLISIAVFGIYLGFLFWATGNLFYSMVTHSIFNTVSLVQLTTMGTQELEKAPFYAGRPSILLPCLLVLLWLIRDMKKGAAAR